MVVSADQVNTTKYVLEVAAGGLDNNAVLTAKDGSGLTIAHVGETGTIEGVTTGTTISDVLDMVNKPASAILNVIDADSNLVPLQILNPDTLKVATRVTGGIYFESIAQDQKTIITYELVLDISASDAWVSSNIFDIAQDNLVISLVPEGVSVQIFLANLIPSGNATIEVLTRDEKNRDSGYVVKDDILRVTSEDASVSVDYRIRFQGTPASTAAYVTSEVYTVNEVLLEISEVPQATQVDAFLANLKPVVGSVMKLVDASGNPKTEGSVVSGDQVVVTAEDGETKSSYSLDVMVSVRDLVIDRINVYPNPANDVLYLSGVPAGSTIHMTSITGRKVGAYKSDTELFELSIEDLAKGYYLL
ncbi:hypothetical protein LCGC14_2766270, partial [marine sediment metagenome]